MNIMTKSAIAASVLGAFWLGVLVAPHVPSSGTSPEPAVEMEARVAAVSRPAAAPRPIADSSSRREASDVEVQRHVKPLLTWGADVKKAAEGFPDAETFMAAAYAAHNTSVPFALLKHRVLTERQTLAAAIRASKPELDAALEADRATLEARSNLARLNS